MVTNAQYGVEPRSYFLDASVDPTEARYALVPTDGLPFPRPLECRPPTGGSIDETRSGRDDGGCHISRSPEPEPALAPGWDDPSQVSPGLRVWSQDQTIVFQICDLVKVYQSPSLMAPEIVAAGGWTAAAVLYILYYVN
jgi:hypothetical protein